MSSYTIYHGASYAKVSSKGRSENSGGIRSEIRTFSHSSRMRLLNFANQINRKKIQACPLFITLTYPRSFPTSHVDCKRHLDTFNKRLSRLFKHFFAIWRLEYQVEGGTRRGAPHYHLILFFPNNSSRVRNIQRFRFWLSNAWYQIVSSNDPKHLLAGTQAQRLKNWHGVIHYTAKYIAKINDTGVPDVMQDLPGRFWGIFHRSDIPIDCDTFEISDEMFYNIRRIFRKLYEVKRNYKYRYRSSQFGLSLYLDSETAFDILNSIAMGGLSTNYNGIKLP